MENIADIDESIQDIPHLVRLLDDDSPDIRDAVLNKLLGFGIQLEVELEKQNISLDIHQQRILDQHLFPLLKEKTLREKLNRFPVFKPGILVKHKRYGYRGVIVDCDDCCKADNDWYEKNNTQPGKNQPWYHVLVNNSGAVTYAAQDSLEKDLSKKQILHPLIPFFFSGFKSGFYIRNKRQWGK